MSAPHVYIAGPLTGDVLGGTRAALAAARAVRARGWVDFTPHTMILADLVSPEPYEVWMAKCLAWVERCDALIRLHGVSPGSDREAVRAFALGLPVVAVDEGGSVAEALDELEALLEARGKL